MTAPDRSSWSALTQADRRTLLTLAALQRMISVALHLSGYARTKRVLHRLSRHPKPHPAGERDLAHGQRVAQLAAIAGRRGPFPTTCLRQALAVDFLLRRQGLQPALKLGVARNAQGPDMHAWVELDGHPLGDGNNRYDAFPDARD